MSLKRRRPQPSLLASPCLVGGDAGKGDGQGGGLRVERLELPLEIERLIPDRRYWELEIGFGKGRYLLKRAQEEPSAGFVGIELASQYFRLAVRRARHRRLGNVLMLRGEALYLLAACLPETFVRAVHVYFPDPWPKSRHHKRRLFEPENLDLLLRVLSPGGALYFATDHLPYGRLVEGLLRSHPRLRVVRRRRWPDGARTNYEAKYSEEGRSVLRLEATLLSGPPTLVHPAGRDGLVVGPAGWPRSQEPPPDEDEDHLPQERSAAPTGSRISGSQ